MRRRILQSITLALAAAAPSLVPAATVAPVAEVVAVQPARAADLVLLRGGFAAGLRQGMVCRVTRSSAEVGEVLLVDLRSNSSAALILGLAPGQSIRAGDLASVKVLKS